MSEWKEVRLGDYIKDIAAGPFGSNLKVSCFVDKGFPIIDGANLKSFKVTDNITKYVTEEKARSLYRSIAKRGDIIVTISGNVGQIAYIPYDSEYKEYLVSQRQFRVTIDDTSINVPFLIYYFHTRIGQSKILSFANQVGVPALSQPLKNFRNITISIPEIKEQKKIASILSSLDSKIENNRKICANLEAQAQALFKHWFIDFAPFKDGKFVESELGRIPEGWRVGKLSCLGDIIGGATPSKSEESYYCQDGIHWLTPKDLSNNCLKFTSRGETDITLEGYMSCSAKILPRGSVLFSSRAPIGYLTISKNEICTNQGFKSIIPRYAGTAYLYYLLKYNTKRIESMASGTTFKEASGSLMKSLPVIIPTKSYLIKFETCAKDLFEEQEVLESQISRLSTLRDTLLPKLMSGEIKV